MQRLLADDAVPRFVRDNCAAFRRAVFDHAVGKEGMRTVFLEPAWNAG